MDRQQQPQAETQGLHNVLFTMLVLAAGVCFVVTALQLLLAANLLVIIIAYGVLVRGVRRGTRCHRATRAHMACGLLPRCALAAPVWHGPGHHFHSPVHHPQRAGRDSQGLRADSAVPRHASAFLRLAAEGAESDAHRGGGAPARFCGAVASTCTV